jgi:hypothetical protein
VLTELTLPLILIHYTARYNQAHQLFYNNKDTMQTIISDCLGSAKAHHRIVENEQLSGRLYSTPSLARPHERINYFSQYGDPIAVFKLHRQHRTMSG